MHPIFTNENLATESWR